MSFKLLNSGGFFEIENNKHIPNSINNRDYQNAIKELESRDLSSYNSSGVYMFYPDEIYLFSADEIIISTLEEYKEKAKYDIDDAAGNIRCKYITSVAGQDATYILKAEDAKNFKTANYPSKTLGNYPFIKGESEATGKTPKQVTDIILYTRLNWIAVAALIEKERIQGKVLITKANGENEIDSIVEQTLANLLLL